MKRALITGATGQDGSYLSELLLENGYEVHGLIRRVSMPTRQRLAAIINNPRFVAHYGDMTDAISIDVAIQKSQPDEIYNLAAMSDVRASYDKPAYTLAVNAQGFGQLLESARRHCATAKIYQASSSEMFGKVQQIPQCETTPFYPRSPYGCSKAAAFYLGRAYREGYGMQVYNGILFNHESPRRGEQFVSRKICKAVAAIRNGGQKRLILGNLDAKRDWGYAKEYAYWIWRILQSDEPDDYLISTGETHTIREWVELAFAEARLDWNDYVEFDPSLCRPAEVDLLLGDSSKARRILGFEPKVKFKELVGIMVKAEMDEWIEEPCISTKMSAVA